MEISVRKAVKSDCLSLVTMIKELATYHRHPDSVKITEDVLIKDGFGDNPWYFSIIAETVIDGNTKPIGFVIYYRTYSTWHGKSFFMEDLYVYETFRKNQVGTKLLKEVAKHALSDGANKIVWNALEWNTGAHEFYKNAGAEMVEDWNNFSLSRPAMEKYICQ